MAKRRTFACKVMDFGMYEDKGVQYIYASTEQEAKTIFKRKVSEHTYVRCEEEN